MGGTFGAVMLQSPLRHLHAGHGHGALGVLAAALAQRELIERMAEWSHAARREGLLSLEGYLVELADPFLRKGLQLLVDGAEPERVREVLEVEIGVQEEQLRLAARVWESAGGYAPTIGILGAVLGLIHVMENLTDPSKLGAGIAVAFVATIYGVGSANLIFLPIAKKLQAHIARLTLMREMFVDGLVGIANGDNPRIIESRLQGYLVP
jgi:chemotaxis protein MotA